ncbi:methyltransferase FkbM family [Richelia sinica FACHB-800]|uniref:Methyltransferase FkbM family n=1 Tax=Richelia sinica FACHB-800 TaxID=1357546 RepID=A0A975Y4F4_9NOST|nr:FkbM family methyltransferase [Richelia sinica]MBD2666136.1 FkbM family methyltransferase [Richelia sinica FACHB-800]QXE23131.1 methyltransferase FkbM family [Richelia sinica FACHB-800]
MDELNLLIDYHYNSKFPVLVDVGAHHGCVSSTFAKKGWKVIAFEPENQNREAFIQNLINFENVTCIPKAVSDVTGAKVPFYVSDEHYGIHSLTSWHKTHKLAYEVETVRLDDVLIELQIASVTLLKIDIEGADFLALKSFDFVKYQPELIMTEFMDERTKPSFGYTHHDVVCYMKDYGYTAFVSEWEDIKEYGREGVATPPHLWIQCVPYPLDHEPAWGNLIFVPNSDQEKFSITLEKYLKQLKKAEQQADLRNLAKKIPGAKQLYNLVKSVILDKQ